MSTKKSEQSNDAGKLSFWQMFRKEYRAHSGKGIVQQQKDMALSDRQRQFLGEAKATVIGLKELKSRPRRVESFEDAVSRQNLSEQQLSAQLQRFKNAHLALYVVAGILLLYALWLALNSGLLVSTGAVFASAGAAIQGYIHGFRAWQIEHRVLIRLQDAIRIPGTYLVL